MLTLRQRAEAYNTAYAKWPASHLHVVQEGGADVLYGRWSCGQDYRNKTRYYGAYPAGYVERIEAVFPDVFIGTPERPRQATDILHVFSGSLPPGEYERCDVIQPAELQCSVYDLPNIILNWRPRLVMADPPYTAKDAKQYGTSGVNRLRATAALAQVTNPGAFLAWLDICWPMHRKREWRTVARICLLRSTNHHLREITIFERVAA